MAAKSTMTDTPKIPRRRGQIICLWTTHLWISVVASGRRIWSCRGSPACPRSSGRLLRLFSHQRHSGGRWLRNLLTLRVTTYHFLVSQAGPKKSKRLQDATILRSGSRSGRRLPGMQMMLSRMDSAPAPPWRTTTIREWCELFLGKRISRRWT